MGPTEQNCIKLQTLCPNVASSEAKTSTCNYKEKDHFKRSHYQQPLLSIAPQSRQSTSVTSGYTKKLPEHNLHHLLWQHRVKLKTGNSWTLPFALPPDETCISTSWKLLGPSFTHRPLSCLQQSKFFKNRSAEGRWTAQRPRLSRSTIQQASESLRTASCEVT